MIIPRRGAGTGLCSLSVCIHCGLAVTEGQLQGDTIVFGFKLKMVVDRNPIKHRLISFRK
jgi:hypothetical protein